MALIRTEDADMEAAVSISQNQLMQPLEFGLTLPIDDPLVANGDVNAWRPVNARIMDGASSIDLAGWVVAIERQDRTVKLTLNDGGIWLRRRTSRRPSSDSKSAGEHISDLISLAISGRETRRATSTAVEGGTNTRWVFEPTDIGGLGMTHSYPVGVASNALAHSEANRALDVTIQPFLTASDPTTVTLIVRSYPTSDQVVWSNTVQYSVDGGTTWSGSFDIQSNDIRPSVPPQYIDLTSDRAWVAADLDNLAVRCVVQASADGSMTEQVPAWWVTDVAIQCDFTAAVEDEFPLRLGSIDRGGPAITLPANELKTLEEWLNYLSDQTNYEWSIESDFDVIGQATLSWQEQLGSALQATVTIDGVSRQVAALEEGVLIAAVRKAGIDGKAIYSRVRVTAQGLDDVVLTNEALALDIGIHEMVKDLGANSTSADQTNTATTLLAQLASPVMQFSVDVPRLPGLWGALELGTTCWLRLAHAPVEPWEGIVRIVGRSIDEKRGVMSLDALSVQDASGSTQPLGSGYQVSAEANTRKWTGERGRLENFVSAWRLARRGAR